MHRLKTRAQFQAAMSANTISRTAHFALHRLAIDATAANAAQSAIGKATGRQDILFAAPGVWIGAILPKRWAKRAVTRNAIKRQIYTMGSGYETRLLPAAHVVRLRSGFDRALYPSAWSDALKVAVRTELQQLFGRATEAERAA